MMVESSECCRALFIGEFFIYDLCISLSYACFAISLVCISTFHCFSLALCLVVVPLWSLYFVAVPLLYNFIFMPFLYDFFPMSCPCDLHALSLWFHYHVLNIQFSWRKLCKFWFLFLLNKHLFLFPSKHVYLEIF